MTGDDETPEVVASVGPLDEVVVLLRDFLHRSGAIRAVAVVGGGPGEGPAVVDCGQLRPIEVEAGGRTVLLPHTAELDVAPPELPDIRQLPPFEVDAAEAKIAAPPGAVAYVAAAVRDLAGLLGGRNVAMVQFRTNDEEVPLGITARAGGTDPLVLSLGEEEFEMDAGWPGRP
ncbi:MAG: hypothetical protein QOD55_2327 [Solirubrobacteraceae bacterium]|jgi:hypothetical protein|nr:hypothetical protein [Solirubrobacteraceae bacterium]